MMGTKNNLKALTRLVFLLLLGPLLIGCDADSEIVAVNNNLYHIDNKNNEIYRIVDENKILIKEELVLPDTEIYRGEENLSWMGIKMKVDLRTKYFEGRLRYIAELRGAVGDDDVSPDITPEVLAETKIKNFTESLEALKDTKISFILEDEEGFTISKIDIKYNAFSTTRLSDGTHVGYRYQGHIEMTEAEYRAFHKFDFEGRRN